jgi:UDP-N-acetylmuramate dehydrogenase
MRDPVPGTPLSKYTTLGTGGPARYLAEPESAAEVEDLLLWAAERDLDVATVGLGSNLLVADDGVDALVLRLRGDLTSVEVGAGVLRAGGGAALAVCLHRARSAGLGGLEFSCAIPGTVGGAVLMNAGAHGGDVAGVLSRALVIDSSGAGWRTPAELGLGYRRSGLAGGQIVVAAEFGLTAQPVDEIRSRVAEMQAWRKATQPTGRRTFGSVFRNPAHELTAGRMLEACGLKGFAAGGARISPKHANFIENTGAARSEDALALIAEARRRAREQFGVRLETEVRLLGRIEVPVLDGPR